MWSNLFLTAKEIEPLVTCIFLVFGTVIAVMGLSTWRKQTKGQTEFDLAKRILSNAYNLRIAINVYRNPDMQPGEINNAVSELKTGRIPEGGYPPPVDSEINRLRAASSIRWRRVREAHEELRKDFVEADALWSDRGKNLLLALNSSIYRLHEAADIYLGADEEDPVIRKNAKMIAMDHGTQNIPDEFSKEFEERINSLERFLKPKLKL